jgi:hypothetical protein
MKCIVRLLVGGLVLTGSLAASAQYQESTGDVAIEAEHYSNNLAFSDHEWLTVCDSTVLNMTGYASNPSGEGVMYAFPDDGTITTGEAPELRYEVEFTNPGIYGIWVRAHAPNPSADSIRIGLDDDQTGSGEIYTEVTLPTGTGYNWTDGTQTLDLSGITPGEVHTINIWMRDDGTFIDMIFLSLNNQTDPRAALPTETAMSSLPPAAAPVISPAGGSFSSSTDITLTSCTPGADIYWSDDGVTAPFDGGPNGPFTSPFTLTDTTTIMAAAFAPATHLDSQTTTADFDFGPPASPTTVLAAVLPASRSVQVGGSATAFGTIINSGTADAIDCSIAPTTTVAADFVYQTTNPTTNALIGTPDTPVDIAMGDSQSFVFAFTPTAEISPTDVQLAFDCTNSDPAPVTLGLNTLLLAASTTPVSDIVALAATPTGDGTVGIPGDTGTGAFAVATVNVGSQQTITASADTGNANLPVTLSICETNPGTGACLAPPADTVTTDIAAGATPTFSVFAQGNGTVAFDPAANRIFVRYQDAGGVTRGSTSVAAQTVTP